jgi:type I restriction enzyme M protein
MSTKVKAVPTKRKKANAKESPASNSRSLASNLPQPESDSRGWIFCPLINEWRSPRPEEFVRQSFILHLNHHYGYTFAQMRQEVRTQHGRRSPRADIVIYETEDAMSKGKTPVVVVECKAENVEIYPRDYYQGESYTRAVGCELFVAHNKRQTAIFKLVPGTPGEFIPINNIPHAADWGDAKKIEELKNSLRAFSRKEFQDLLFKCHSILRDVHKMEPGRAFDAISKVLFIKMYIERTGTWGTFTTNFLDQRAAVRLPTDKQVHEQLFDQTKKYYATDELFTDRDELEISEETFRRIVKELERFNLSATGDDIKGLAFEKFLGDTFRGELGQFFTPRPVVDFMVELLDPQEGELICDPAAGSGGFLIKAFEHIRNKIANDIQNMKDEARTSIEALNLPEDEEEKRIEQEFARFNKELDPDQDNPPSRIRKLAHNCIYGTDAEPRAARTAKMNMIMHGDGHGGIHYHDGLVDINGIFPERFHVVFTNPQFGGNVGDDQKFGSSEQTRVPTDTAYEEHCRERYGKAWEESHMRTVVAAKVKKKILDSFEIGKGKPNRPTEILFLERCLQILRPGGRMGIVLPDGNLNNPSLSWLRRWAEGKAKVMSVVSLPAETFVSADATVKASLVFLRKFTENDKIQWEETWQQAHSNHDVNFNEKRTRLCLEYAPGIISGENPEVENLFDKLEPLGVRRELPKWKQSEPPDYPRGIGATIIGKPQWIGTGSDKNKITKLKKDFYKLWDDKTESRAEVLLRELRSKLRKVDSMHTKALWLDVRERFDYPVFTSAPDTVGITSTGAEGPNQLPEVLHAWRWFDRWVKAGANEAEIPVFES